MCGRVGLRYRAESERGATLRGHRAGVDLTLYRTSFGQGPFHCMTAMAAHPQRSFVAHHRAFPNPSIAKNGAPRVDTGDEAFEKSYETYGRLVPPLAVRNALLTLPCAELTILLDRVTVVWPADNHVPAIEELDAARTAIEALARADEGDAYR